MNVFLYHISFLLDTIFFGLGIVSVLLIRKRLSKYIVALLNIAKIFAGAAIAIMLFFTVPPQVIIGTGLDIALSYIAGVLITAGALQVETDLI